MTLDEAIKHCEEKSCENRKLAKRYDDASGYSRSGNKDIRTNEAKKCEKCAEEHRQLAEWLKDYKRLLEQEPTVKIALNRYRDLQNYFADANMTKTILENRKIFRAWLERLRWNTKKIDELARKLDALKQEPKTGRWIKNSDSYGNNHFTCPFCGHDIATKYNGPWKDNYCSNCGARMSEVSE